MSAKRKLFCFWGCMDALALVVYVIHSLRHGRVPFVTDVQAFFLAGDDRFFGIAPGLLFLLDATLLLSLFVSAWLFLNGSRYALHFALGQELLRFIAFRSSVTLLPLFIGVTGLTNPWVNLPLFLLGEAVKIGSLIRVSKKTR